MGKQEIIQRVLKKSGPHRALQKPSEKENWILSLRKELKSQNARQMLKNLTKYNHYCPVREFCLLHLPGNDGSECLPSDRMVALRLAPGSEDIAVHPGSIL